MFCVYSGRGFPELGSAMSGVRFVRAVRFGLPLALAFALGAPVADAAPTRTRQVAAAPVVTAKAERRDVPRLARTVGNVVASTTVQIKPQIEGRVIEAGFVEGQLVSAGALLFRIDPRPFQAELDQAQALLARDQAQLDQARLELARQKDLSTRGVASAQRYEQAQADAKALAASVAADAAAVASAKLKLGYTEIRSPIAGKTGTILVHPGNIVKANETALVSVSAIEPVRVAVTLPQQLLPVLQARMREGGTELLIDVPGGKGETLSGRVDFIGDVVDPLSGTIAVRATFSNADHRLVPGQFVTASIVLEVLKDAVAVPFEAVNTGQHGPYVYVIDADGKAQARDVAVLYADAGVAALRGEIAPGERVVVDGQLRLAPGVATTEAKAPAAP